MVEKIYTVKEVAEMLGYKETTIRKWIREGSIKAFMIGKGRRSGYRVKEKEIEKRIMVK